MKKSLASALTAALGASTLVANAPPTAADDVAFGIGATYVPGRGPAVGIKIFSDDDEHSTVGGLGLDYLIKTGEFRPNLSIVYLGDDHYTDLNIGFGLKTKQFDFGIGGGAADAKPGEKNSPAAPACEGSLCFIDNAPAG